MPNVTINYKMFLPGGHHRQPRNTSVDLDLAPTAGGNYQTGSPCTPVYFPKLPYDPASDMAQLQFWNVTDGTAGHVFPPDPLTVPVGSSPLWITAWYYPISGPGVGNGSVIIDDAFSANSGNFIDDTFVDVTSDPSLTSDANVIGVVPTKVAETLKAKVSVPSTSEPFSRWILNSAFMQMGTTTLEVPAKTSGIAIAVYQKPDSDKGYLGKLLSQEAAYDRWWWIETHGGLVPPGHGDPWVTGVTAAVTLVEAAKRVSPSLRAAVLEVAIRQMSNMTAEIKKQINTLQKENVQKSGDR
jgi:hypothetical protein